MVVKWGSKGRVALAALALTLPFLAVACSSSVPGTRQGTPPAEGTAAPADGWSALLRQTPFPYTTPLPPAEPTALDGTYVKFNPKPGTPVPCRRCPEYLPEGGIWKLQFDNGIFPDTRSDRPGGRCPGLPGRCLCRRPAGLLRCPPTPVVCPLVEQLFTAAAEGDKIQASFSQGRADPLSRIGV